MNRSDKYGRSCNELSVALQELSSSPDNIEQALMELQEIISDYQKALPPEVAQSRKELLRLKNAMDEAIAAFADLSVRSISHICDALNGPYGTITIQPQLKLARDAAQNAYSLARKIPNKQKNADLRVLAYRVAEVVENTLHLPVSLTRDSDENIKGNRGGAAYARLLRVVMECAGEVPPDDLYPLMKQGLTVQENPHGNPHLSQLE